MSFLETITFMGNDVLVSIKDIKYVMARYGNNGWEICIKGDGDYEWTEHFGKDEEKYRTRYEMIKYILGVEKEKSVLAKLKKK